MRELRTDLRIKNGDDDMCFIACSFYTNRKQQTPEPVVFKADAWFDEVHQLFCSHKALLMLRWPCGRTWGLVLSHERQRPVISAATRCIFFSLTYTWNTIPGSRKSTSVPTLLIKTASRFDTMLNRRQPYEPFRRILRDVGTQLELNCTDTRQ